MTEQSILVPQRRFKEFKSTQVWEEIELKNMGKTFTGLSGKTKDDFGHGSAEFVTYMNVFSNPISDTTMTENVEIDLKQNKLEYGDVLFTVSSETPQEVGMSSVWLSNRPNVYLNSFCFGYRPTVNVSYLFLAYLFRSDTVRKKMMLLAQGISRYNISKNKVMELQVGLTNIYEQEKIGNFFKQLDHTISLHRRKLEKIKALKSAYLSEMFPAEGEREPKRRFVGFTGTWKQHKLSKLANYRRGSFPQPYGAKEWYDKENGMPFVQVVDVGKNLKLVNNTKQKISKLAQPLSVFVEKGKVLITLQGSIGRVAITQYPCYVDRTLLIFESYKRPINEYYFAYVIQQLFEKEKLKAPGGTIKTITKEALSDFHIFIPSIEEQSEIAEFLKQFDNAIVLHQRKLEKLQNLKKAYLHEMFI